MVDGWHEPRLPDFASIDCDLLRATVVRRARDLVRDAAWDSSVSLGLRLVAASRVLEQQRGHRHVDLVAAADRGGRELELAVAPVEEAHHPILRRAVARGHFDLE